MGCRKALLSLLFVSSILVLTIVLTFIISSLDWPLGSNLSYNPDSNQNQRISEKFGTLYLIAVYREKTTLSCRFCPQFPTFLGDANGLYPNNSIMPIGQLQVFILRSGSVVPLPINHTFANGTLRTLLPPAEYSLRIQDHWFNLSMVVQVVAGVTTVVSLIVNRTFYPVMFYDIFDRDSSPAIGDLGTVFVKVQSTRAIPNASQTVFIETVRNATEEITTYDTNYATIPTYRVDNAPVTILSESLQHGALWIRLRPNSLLNYSSILSMNLVTYAPQYSVNSTSSLY